MNLRSLLKKKLNIGNDVKNQIAYKIVWGVKELHRNSILFANNKNI